MSKLLDKSLWFKEQILQRFNQNASHYGTELSLGILAETASEFVFEKLDQIPPVDSDLLAKPVLKGKKGDYYLTKKALDKVEQLTGEHRHTYRCEGCDAVITNIQTACADLAALEALSNQSGTKVTDQSVAKSNPQETK